MRFVTPNKEETVNFVFYSVDKCIACGMFMVIECLTVCL